MSRYRTSDALCGIYKIVNNVNGKVYIGQSINIEKRWKEHIISLNSGKSRCTLLQRAWNKYGQDNFSFDILELCSEDMLDVVEIKYISMYDSCGNGYNIESGGNKNKHLAEETKQKIRESHIGKTMSEETVKKMSKSRMGEKNPMYGQTHSEEARRKISEARKGKPGHPTSEKTKELIRKANTGKVMSEATKQKISKAMIGSVPHNKNLRPVYCIELSKTFDNPTSASEELNIRSGNIINCCEHTRKTCGGYHWMYADSDEYNEFLNATTIQN